MTKYIVEMPNNVSIKDGVITITGGVGWSVIEKAVHNAVEVVEVKEAKDIVVMRGKLCHWDGDNPIAAPVTLYAVKREDGKAKGGK